MMTYTHFSNLPLETQERVIAMNHIHYLVGLLTKQITDKDIPITTLHETIVSLESTIDHIIDPENDED